MARYDDSQPYTPDYEDDCADCGEEFPRGELAWSDDLNELLCADCEVHREDLATIPDSPVPYRPSQAELDLAEHRAQVAGRPWDGIPEV